jgi:hypothetical protein
MPDSVLIPTMTEEEAAAIADVKDGPIVPPVELPSSDPIFFHFFDETTKEYLGGRSVTEADPIPPNATLVWPPPSQTGFSIVWDSEFWNLVADHRGEVWYDANGNPVTITELGDPADNGLTPTPPPTP